MGRSLANIDARLRDEVLHQLVGAEDLDDDTRIPSLHELEAAAVVELAALLDPLSEH